MEDKEAKSIIEAMLFIFGDPISLDTLRKIIDVDKYNTERLVREIINEYAIKNTGIMILEVAEGFQMVTNPVCAPWIKKLLCTVVPKKLTQSSLETMAIIAYKQPIIKSEIEAIRGVNSDGVVKTLLEKRLVTILGRKEVPGRPLMYGTTNEFLHYFGLKDLTELPTLKEFEEVDIPEPPEGAPEGMDVLQAMKGEGKDEPAEIFEEKTEVILTDPEPEDELIDELKDESNDESEVIDEEIVEVSEEEQEMDKAQTGSFDDEHRPAE